MTQFVLSPLDEAWKVTYGTNFLADILNDRISVYEIKSEKNGHVTPGLIPEAQAMGFGDEYIETTVTTLVAFAVEKGLNIRMYADRQPEANLNTTFAIITGLSFANGAVGVVNEEAKTIAIDVPYGTVVTGLKPIVSTHNNGTLTVGLTEIESGETAVNFTNAVTLTVTSADGTETEDYTVTVTVLKNTEKAITSFKFESLEPDAVGVIDEATHTIAVDVPNGTVVTALVPTIVISAAASVSPNTGVAQDFTAPVTYTVTADDSTTQDYTVSVTILQA